jgi:hypothetical protein
MKERKKEEFWIGRNKAREAEKEWKKQKKLTNDVLYFVGEVL